LSNYIILTHCTVNILCYLRTSFLIFSSTVEHWSDAYSCPSLIVHWSGKCNARQAYRWFYRSLASQSCCSISPKVHCSTNKRRFYCIQRKWPPSLIVNVHSPLYRSKWKSMISSIPTTSSIFVRCIPFSYSNNGKTFEI